MAAADKLNGAYWRKRAIELAEKQKQEDDAGYHSRQVDELAAFQTEDHSQEKHQQEPAVINDAKVS